MSIYLQKNVHCSDENPNYSNAKQIESLIYCSQDILFQYKQDTSHSVYWFACVPDCRKNQNFFDTTENLHGSKLTKRILFYSVNL